MGFYHRFFRGNAWYVCVSVLSPPLLPLKTISVYVIYHHYTLWDRRKGALIALCAALAVTYIPAMTLGWHTVVKYQSKSDSCEVLSH